MKSRVERNRIEGIGERVPQDEELLWTGTPDTRALAVHVFHVRKVALYFALLAAWRGWEAGLEGASALLGLGVAAIGILLLLARLTSRNTVYAITDRRILMRIGIAFPKVINLPLTELDGAADRRRKDGSGDVAFQPAPDSTRIPFFLLWPHARAWRFSPPEPALRGLRDVGDVVRLLRSVLARSEDEAVELRPRRPAETPASGRDDRVEDAVPALDRRAAGA